MQRLDELCYNYYSLELQTGFVVHCNCVCTGYFGTDRQTYTCHWNSSAKSPAFVDTVSRASHGQARRRPNIIIATFKFSFEVDCLGTLAVVVGVWIRVGEICNSCEPRWRVRENWRVCNSAVLQPAKCLFMPLAYRFMGLKCGTLATFWYAVFLPMQE